MSYKLLKTAPKLSYSKLSYYGWQIRIVVQSGTFCFHCYPPERSSYCNDGEVYPSFKSALKAARHFVKWELAVQALTEALGDCLETGVISEEEYWNLTNFA